MMLIRQLSVKSGIVWDRKEKALESKANQPGQGLCPPRWKLLLRCVSFSYFQCSTSTKEGRELGASGLLKGSEDSDNKLPKDTTALNHLRSQSAGTTWPPTEPSSAPRNPKVSHTRARKSCWVVLKYFKKL